MEHPACPTNIATLGDIGVLGVDVLPTVFGFLDWNDILLARVCKKWKEAAALTLVPPSSEWKCIMQGQWPKEVEIPQFSVTSASKYAALSRMRDILPGLQSIYLGPFYRDSADVSVRVAGVPTWALLQGGMAKTYIEGNEPDVRILEAAQGCPSYDVSIIADFQHLRHLRIERAPLNGKYPCLFGLKGLRELRISNCEHLKFDLDMLAGMPRLEIVECTRVGVSGNLEDLGVLKSTLRELIIGVHEIRGDVMNLSDFPELTVLDVEKSSNVTVDLGQIRATHFPRLQKLYLPKAVDRIDNSSSVIGVLHSLAQRTSSPCMGRVQLSDDSPDRYSGVSDWRETSQTPVPPFFLEMVKAGTRLGWRWTNLYAYRLESCETNWLDPAPDANSDGYSKYQSELEEIQKSVKFYRGFFKPPSEEEYQRLCREEKEWWRRKHAAIASRIHSAAQARAAGRVAALK